jgi:hypothetical protein
MKTFNTAGVSKLKGKLGLRGTNREGDTYANILKKDGHTDIHMVHLKHPMNKEEAKKYLAGLKAFQTPEILACLKDTDGKEKKETKAAKEKVAKPAKSKAPPKAKSTKKKAVAEPDESEVPAETDDGAVNVHEELGVPAFAKHVDTETD